MARSTDLTHAAALLGATAAATAAGSWALDGFLAYARRALSTPRWDQPGLALWEGLEAGMRVAAPVILAALTVGLAVGLAQTGSLFTARPLEPQLDRLNPLRTLERLFSLRSAAELLKAVVKLAAVVAALWGTLREVVADPGPLAPSAAEVAGRVGHVLRTVAWRGALALGVLGVLDYLYQRFEHERGLRMTRQEVREDLRETEGDPVIRARQRARQRELARRRMLREVARATVVVTNPTHLAVALRYAPPQTPAPVVVAKGAGSVAERIRDAARRHGVPLVPNPPLAQALYRRVPLGGMIPPTLYRAVAEILALLYRAGRLREVPL